MNAIGRLFGLLRSGVPYRDFARKLGTSYSHVYRAEHGFRLPSVKVVISAGRALGLPARQVEILLLCQRSNIDAELAVLAWSTRTAEVLEIANVLLKTFGCCRENAFHQAELAIARCANPKEALAAVKSKVPPCFEEGKPA